MAATQHDEVRKVYVRCRLGKSELNRLFSLACEGIPAVSISVSTQRDSTRYSAATLIDLIDHIRNSNASGNLDTWDNLSLEAADTTGSRKVNIKIDTERVEVQISGLDATWVHGQTARIELFLKGAGGQKKDQDVAKGMRKRLPVATVVAILPTAAMMVGGYALAPQAMKSTKSTQDQIAGAVGMLAGLLPLFLAGSIGYWIVLRTNRAVLKPTMEVPHGSWWSRASSADKIALAGLMVATLSFFVALAALGKDLIN
ncbi:hypothetical protein OG613_31910 [Streptomyces sp. NBC_00015]|uniref:hypothetical protein n=1 Tax=unclassified Streptomyces TaxID=2593676 RepID=UPI0022502F99|nr:hypothetical protein [Streptomyces sp. NBC_00103]MCX5367660.1 hypothetical protein [Streptomyces sp. NBC_00103]